MFTHEERSKEVCSRHPTVLNESSGRPVYSDQVATCTSTEPLTTNALPLGFRCGQTPQPCWSSIVSEEFGSLSSKHGGPRRTRRFLAALAD